MPVQPSFPVPVDSVIHLIGIGGTGMSPLATVLKQAGYTITGSDLRRSPTVEALIELGIPTSIGHDPSNVTGAGLVIRSSAVPESNAEVRQALHLGIPVLKHAEFLGLLSRTRRTLAVAGTHGKTTTTAMLATILLAAGLDPTVLVGGVVPLLGSGARLGSSEWLVVEADEFDRRFLELRPEIAIVTNVEADHLDYFGDLSSIEQAFRGFLGPVPEQGWIVASADDPVAARLAAERTSNAVTFGLSALAEWRAVGISRNDLGGNDFYVQAHGTLVGRFRLPVPGVHNVCDALAAIVAAGRVGADFTVAATALERFATVERRLERKGCVNGVVVYDDYAHNPTKIRASLAALREQHEGRIVCLYQPHTYHRLQSLFDDFVHAFGDADLVVVTDVYEPAGRGPGFGARTAEDLAQFIVGTATRYGGDLRSALDLVAREARRGDFVVTMGAGDVTVAGPEILRILAEREDPS